MPSFEMDVVLRLAVASLCGLAVGVEREWSGDDAGPHFRFAGVRTLFLLGGVAGVAGYLFSTGLGVAAAVLLTGGIVLVATAYLRASQGGTPGAIDATTEVAALVVLALGVLAGLGHLAIASGAAAIVVVALSEKSRLHDAIARVDEHELRAAFHFAVLALVVLPVLPSGSYGPLGGIRPRDLWIVVLIFSGLSYLGYIARKVVGQSRGDIVAGALGGVISSTAVTWQFSRRSRTDPVASTSLALGVVAACTVHLFRIVVLSAVLNYAVAIALLPILALPFMVGASIVGWSMFAKRSPSSQDVPVSDGSPLRFWSALRMALAFQVTLMAIDLVRSMLGDRGVLASAAVVGLTDTDALTLSMNRLGDSPEVVVLAAKAITIGVVSNNVVKMTLAVVLGSAQFRRTVAAGLMALVVSAIAALVFVW